MSEKSETRVEAVLILEILGKPATHLKETLKDIIKKMGEEKGVEVRNSTVHEPKEIEERKDFFTTFAEVEIEVENIINLIAVMFKFMPSHIEIIYPEKITVSNQLMSDFMTGIIGRLHQYDELARVLQNERMILEAKLKDILEKKKGTEMKEETAGEKDNPLKVENKEVKKSKKKK